MFQRRQRRFRRRPNGGGHHHLRGDDHLQSRQRSNSFTNGQIRNNFRTTQSAEKLFEKYSSLAKEAISSGDKTLVENYLQHADHFMRIIEEKNKNRAQSKVEAHEKVIVEENRISENNNTNTKQEEVVKEKD